MATNNNWNNQISVANSAITLNSGTNGINISTDASAATLSIGTGAAVKTVTIGSTTSTSSTTINFGGSGGGTLSTYVPTTTWTPVLAFGGSSTGITYGGQTGSYMRIGNLVYFTCNVTLTNKGSATGSATITGLPITVATGGAVSNRLVTVAFTGTISTRVAGTSIILEGLASAGTLTVLNETAFSNTSQLIISGTYLA